MSRYLNYFLPFFCIICLALIFYFFDLYHFFTLETLKEKQHFLISFAQDHPILFPILFFLVYVISVALIIPDSTVLSLLGGLTLPIPFAVFLIATAETLGALFFFWVLRLFFKGILKKNAAIISPRMQHKFQAHAASFLLFLRFSHILPFWLTTLCAAYFFTPLWTFIWTTWVGVLPLSFLVADIGHHLSKVFASNEPLTLSSLFSPSIKLALFGLGLLALVPLIFQYWINRKAKRKL
jgi:uncharacterized membrane protein YdjX (TVP38/TMEM64 family)